MATTAEPDFRTLALAVLNIEAQAIHDLRPRIDARFDHACRLLLACQGRIVVSGIGKSGHIGHKIAATLASTGSPAFFVHPAEANHGDLGMLQPGDVFIGISNSGSSGELLTLIPGLKRLGVTLIAMTGEMDSSLASAADEVLDVSVAREACPLGLAPTASTTATLAMGDALAVALLGARGFSAEDFARSHPGGRLGRQLLLRVSDVMSPVQSAALVAPDKPIADTLLAISSAGLGLALVVDTRQRLLGVFTDGDLRRAIDARLDVHQQPVGEAMTVGGQTIGPDELAINAVTRMQRHTITALPVLTDGQVSGVVTMHALLAAGVV